MSINHMLNETFDIQINGISKGIYGETVDAWVTTWSGIPGRLQRFSRADSERIFTDKTVVWSDYVLYLLPTQTIKAEYRVLYTDLDGVDRVFEVRSVDNSNQMAHHKRVELLEIR